MLWKIKDRKFAAMVVIIGFSIFSLATCTAEPRNQKKAAAIRRSAGVFAGDAVEGRTGKQSGQLGINTVVGNLTGGLAGGTIGHYALDHWRTEDAAIHHYGYSYTKAKATLVKIEDAFASPRTVRRGGTIELSTSYTALGPKGATLDVIETWEIRNGGKLTGTVQRLGGTYTSKLPLTLTADAQKGTYTVDALIQSGSSSDSKEFTFTVQ